MKRREFLRRASTLGAAAAGWAVGCGRSSGGARRSRLESELNVFNWWDYVADDTIANFEREFGVKVNYDIYQSNEELLGKLQGGASGYDVVVPSNSTVTVLRKLGKLAPIHPETLANWNNLDAVYLDPPFDPGNAYTVPYLFGTTGIAFDSAVAPGVDSWGVFLDPSLGGRMTMLNVGREVLGAMLKYRGHSLNSTDMTALEQARRDALAARHNLRGYLNIPVQAQLVSGDVAVAQVWSGFVDPPSRQARPTLRYSIPREGSAIWMDSLVLMADAPHPRAARAFLDYLLRPGVAAAIADHTYYGSPNRAARPLLRHPAPLPTEAERARLEYFADVGAATTVYDHLWTEVKAA